MISMVDGSNGEPAMSEEDELAMEEVYRFRLLGVKRVRIKPFVSQESLTMQSPLKYIRHLCISFDEKERT